MSLLAPPPRPRVVATALACTALLTGCSTSVDASPDLSPPRPPTTEVRTAAARLVLTHDGGILVLDAETLDPVAEFEIDGFNRLNPAGDERHVLVSTAGGFRVLDTGVWSRAHGDHAHHYAADPALTDVVFEAVKPGHVVRHAGRTVVFDDGTGGIESFDSSHLTDGRPETTTFTTAHPHHGVAVELTDGRLVTTVGTEHLRTGIVVLDAARREIARTDECPGVHGESVAADEAIVLGCEDGVAIYRAGAITKVPSPDPYGRIGNQAGSDHSTVVLGDYKRDRDAKLERPQVVSLVDTVTGTLRLVDLGTSYTFRSLGRGPLGEALVLGTDGALHVIDPVSATVTRRIPVLGPWTEPTDWQTPRPALVVQDATAYVSDPAARRIHAVDLDSGAIVTGAELPHTPDEITAVRG